MGGFINFVDLESSQSVSQSVLSVVDGVSGTSDVRFDQPTEADLPFISGVVNNESDSYL